MTAIEETAIMAAYSRTNASTSAEGTARLSRPMACASVPFRRRAVNMISRA